MPKSKAQLKRILGIDDRLNRWYRVKKSRLARIFNVSEKTIQRDIGDMIKDYKAPITFDKNGYFYTENFNIPLSIPLSSTDITKLQIAVKTLNQFQHLEVFKGLENVITNIENSVLFKLPNLQKNFIHFENIPYNQGTELIEFFVKAIESSQIVEFDYQSYKSDTLYHHVFHPYVLKEHTNRWYVIGFLPDFDSITPFALDRIKQNENLKMSDNTFKPLPTFDINDYFKHTYGMTVYSEKEISEIVLSFSPLQAKYFRSKPFHSYKILVDNEDQFTVKMNLIPNYELIRKLASMGNGVKIIKPKSLENSLIDYLKKALSQYKT